MKKKGRNKTGSTRGRGKGCRGKGGGIGGRVGVMNEGGRDSGKGRSVMRE